MYNNGTPLLELTRRSGRRIRQSRKAGFYVVIFGYLPNFAEFSG